MNVGTLSTTDLAGMLAGPGLRLRTGSFVSRIRSRDRSVVAGIALQYSEHPVEPASTFADFHLEVATSRGVRRFVRPQAFFTFDGAGPFHPLPGDQAFPLLEWGLNWCIAGHCHRYLILHAAVIERGGAAAVLPAPPGSGKSTLCAALVNRGWRLLSDELTIVDPATGEVVGLARPVSLKNASIEAIRRFAPLAVLGPAVHDTAKGSVAHMKPPADSVARVHEKARVRWVILPRYRPGSGVNLSPLPRANAFMQLADNAFNYSVHGRRGFETLAGIIDGAECQRFEYSDMEAAVRTFDALASAARR